jgi:hypothetical protein
LRWRLAERLGIADANSIELSDDAWNYWHALSIVDDWENSGFAMLSAHLHNSLMVLAAKLGGTVSDNDIKTTADFVRKFRWEQKTQSVQTGDKQFAVLKAGLGLIDG